MQRLKVWWQRREGPVKIGIVFAVLGIVLTIIGIVRDPTTPATVWSIGMGSLIAGGVWGIVSWAIATAAMEVEEDVRAAEAAQAAPGETEDVPQ
jgi:hypothetical protein